MLFLALPGFQALKQRRQAIEFVMQLGTWCNAADLKCNQMRLQQRNATAKHCRLSTSFAKVNGATLRSQEIQSCAQQSIVVPLTVRLLSIETMQACNCECVAQHNATAWHCRLSTLLAKPKNPVSRHPQNAFGCGAQRNHSALQAKHFVCKSE